MASRPRSSAEEHRLDMAEGHVRLVPRVLKLPWCSGKHERLRISRRGFESFWECASISSSTGQSTAFTRRRPQVRVLPDRRWSWCSGAALRTVNPPVPGRNRLITPCQMWATAAQSPVKRPPRASPVRLGDLARIACFRWRTPPLGFRSPDAPFDSGRKRSCRASHWRGRRSAKPPSRGPIPRRGSGGPKPTGMRQPPPKGKTARSTRAGPAQGAHATDAPHP